MSAFLSQEELDDMKQTHNFLCEASDVENAKNIIYDALQHARQIIVIKNPRTSNSQMKHLHSWIRLNYFCTPIKGGYIVNKR